MVTVEPALILSAPRARVVLVGSARHAPGSALPDRPSVAASVTDLGRLLTERAGLDPGHLRVVVDPDDPATVAAALSEAADQADVLVFGYVGHGLMDPAGDLYLATRATTTPDLREGMEAYQALPYAAVRRILAQARARLILVVIDCCFAGRAAATGHGDPPERRLLDHHQSGMYVLTSAGRDTQAWAPPGATHTAFTGALIDLITDGDPTAPSWLSVDDCYRSLCQTLSRRRLPPPQRHLIDAADRAVLMPNPARPASRRRPPAGIRDDAHAASARALVDGSDVAFSPYRGLASFGPEDAEFFFGRRELTDELLGRVTTGPRAAEPLVVTGASGAGKSSVLMAGLLPRLQTASIPVIAVTGSFDPMGQLARRLTPPAGTGTPTGTHPGTDAIGAPGHIRAQPQHEPHTIGALLKALNPPPVIIVDQFEELFTTTPSLSPETTQPHDGDRAAGDSAAGEADDIAEHARRRIVEVLHAAAAHTPVVIAVRADFFGHCAAYPLLLSSLHHPVVVGPMTTDQLQEAIEAPAARADLDLEPGLVELLLDDVGAIGAPHRSASVAEAALPLLSHALLATWQRSPEGILTLAAYRESNGVAGALAQTADTTLQDLPPAGQDIARTVLTALVRLGDDTADTRRRLTHDEVAALAPASGRPAVDDVVKRFTDARLLTTTSAGVELAHEALIRAWPLFGQWLDADRAARLARQRLTDDARQWARRERDPAFLYRGTRLEDVPDTDRAASVASAPGQEEMSDVEQDFVAAGKALARRDRRRRRWVTSALAVLTAASLAGGTVAVNAARQATDTARRASEASRQALSRQFAAQSVELAGTDAAMASRLAATAWTVAPTPDAHFSLRVAAAYPERASFAGHQARVAGVAFSPDGHTVASAGVDGMVGLWDTTTHRQIGALTGLFSVDAVAFSPDGRILAGAGGDGTVRLWDTTTHRQIGTIISKQGRVSGLAFSPKGHTLAGAGYDGTVRLWDTTTHHQIGAPLTGHRRIVTEVAFSPDGRTLISAGDDGRVRLWNATTHRQIGTPITSSKHAAHHMALNPDAQTVASAGVDGTVRLWDTATHRQIGAPLTGHQDSVWGLAFSPDGHALASAGIDGTVRLWDAATHRQIGAPLTGHQGSVSGVAFSPDGRTLASAGFDGTVRLWDAATHRQIGAPLTGHQGPVSGVAFSPDGTRLASASDDKTIRVWDAATHRQLGAPLTGHQDMVFAVAFSPDGRTLASGGQDKTVRLWDTATHRQIGTPITGHPSSVYEVAFSPDGRTLASVGDNDGRVWLWDTATHRQIGTPITGHQGSVSGLAFSPDGHILASAGGDGTVRLWDTTTHRQIGTPITGHPSSVYGLAFSPDGRTLASAGGDGTVRLWDTTTHRQIGTPITGHLGDVSGLAFSPDGRTLASAGDGDGTVRLWNVAEPNDLLSAACATAGSPLTREEWSQYTPSAPYEPGCAG